jgi:hypothetical protein
MPTRRLALCGTKVGPWVSTKGVEEPLARVTGLHRGALLYVRTGEGLLHIITKDGLHPLAEAEWMRCSVEGESETCICEIVSKRVA